MNATGCMASNQYTCPEITPSRCDAIENAALTAGIICAAGGAGAMSGYLIRICTDVNLLTALGGGGLTGACMACMGLVAEDAFRCRSISVPSDTSPNHLPVANQPGRSPVLQDVIRSNEAVNRRSYCENDDQKTDKSRAAYPSIILTEPPPYEELSSNSKKLN